ncbi:aspartate--tRNA(Asn) ligase [Patescibacteria group bacterium]
MERIYIKDLKDQVDQEVKIAGWIDVRRDQGKMVFFDFRDVSGKVQGVVLPNSEAIEIAKETRPEWVVEVVGKVNKRPEKMVNADVENGDIEIEVLGITVLSEAEVPFELDEETNLDTYLDNQPYLLRSDKNKAIFKVQSEIIKAFRASLNEQSFTEVQSPKIVGGDAEGGAGVFEVDYFGNKAGLATSPQFYKQMMVAVFERVFITGNAFRAEKHSTSRHINEYTSLDFELGFIKDHTDVMSVLESTMRGIVDSVEKTCSKELEMFGVELPKISEKIPVMKLSEAQEILEKEFDLKAVGEPDLEPEHERKLCEYARDKFDSDFIFITHYPVSKRPFYTHEDEDDKGFTKSFDLLFRGVEITTGGQRRHTYDSVVDGIKGKGLNPDDFSFYLQAFKTGMPPHGGIGMGLERLTQKMLNLDNVKKATLFPREINRIDSLLNE